jgi:hypothetical protein
MPKISFLSKMASHRNLALKARTYDLWLQNRGSNCIRKFTFRFKWLRGVNDSRMIYYKESRFPKSFTKGCLEPFSAKPAQRSSHTGPPGYIGCTDGHCSSLCRLAGLYTVQLLYWAGLVSWLKGSSKSPATVDQRLLHNGIFNICYTLGHNLRTQGWELRFFSVATLHWSTEYFNFLYYNLFCHFATLMACCFRQDKPGKFV